jgi:cholesterol oxidase
MSEHFDAIVIGSGFGGSVMTYRLAEAGMKVCLLERGRAYPPNTFPRAPQDLGKNFWDPSEGLYGMFNLWSFKGSGAVVSSGLGGGSLIYANILIRKDEKWFVNESPDKKCYENWLVTRAQLDPHYDCVEKMMNVQKYPLGHPPYNTTEKTLAMQEAAQKVNCKDSQCSWVPLNLAVSFKSRNVSTPDEDIPENPPIIGAPIFEEYENIHAVRAKRPMPRSTCRLCGECDIGCNFGSKNTLDYTYISAAIHQKPHPAEVRTLCEVKFIKPNPKTGKGYEVSYVIHDPENPPDKKRKIEITDDTCEKITCDYLILSGGTFGTPYLLLKMKKRGLIPNLNDKTLGSRYSVNGDLLSFIVNAKKPDGNGRMIPRSLNSSFGPVITSAIRFGDDLDGNGQQGRGFYVEDGGNPHLMSWLSEISGIGGYFRRLVHFVKINLMHQFGFSHDSDLGAEIAELLGDSISAKSSLPILTMGRDCPDGRLFLDENTDFLDCSWSIKGSQSYYDRVERELHRVAEALNAKYEDNPAFRWNFHQVLTAHPLGGCPMGKDETDGVTDSCGEVYGNPGLFVADGSVLPGPVGPNPSLTIAALADRFADHIIARHKGEKHECDYNGK